MKRAAKGFFMALGMFTAIPCPYRPWDEDARDWMLAMLPAVGLVIGLLWAGLAWLDPVPPLRASLTVALPWLLTGFIHLDGYMDTCDAMLSWRPLEKRLEILKDSHAGSYAVVGLVLLALLSYDAAAHWAGDRRVLIFIPIVSRCGSALSVLTLRPLGHSQYAGTRGGGVQRGLVIVFWLLALGACALMSGPAALVLLIETAAYAASIAWVCRAMKGVSGDLAGFALTVSECAALVAAAALQGPPI